MQDQTVVEFSQIHRSTKNRSLRPQDHLPQSKIFNAAILQRFPQEIRYLLVEVYIFKPKSFQECKGIKIRCFLQKVKEQLCMAVYKNSLQMFCRRKQNVHY